MTAAIAALAAITLAATAARAGIAPDGEATQVHVASAGQLYRGAIVIRNPGTSVATVKLYQTDYTFAADGSNAFDGPARLPRSNAAWLRLHREQVTLGPGDLASVDYQVQVPMDASLSGTYWSVVMLQELPGAEASGQKREGMKLGQSLRHAIQIVTEIGATGRGQVTFRNARLVDSGGERAFSVDLENTGERWLRTELWLELHDEQGKYRGRFTAPRRRTFPGTSVRSRFVLAGAPAGKYMGLLVADGGRGDIFGMQVELDLR
jgi:hypothetical protein